MLKKNLWTGWGPPPWLLAGLALFGARLAAQTPPAHLQVADALAAGRPVTIAAFGDSVTGVYYHTGGQRAWSDLLGSALRRVYPHARLSLVNAGVSGNTSAQGLARLSRDVLAVHPQLVVTMFGLNDVAKGRGPAEYRANLRSIVQRCRAAGAESILLTPNPVQSGDPDRPAARVAQYAQIVREVAAAERVPLADAFAAYLSVRLADPSAADRLMSQTIHPNLRGQAIFAEEVAWVLTSQRVWLADLAEADRAQTGPWPQVRARVAADQPVRVLAMAPFDRDIGLALQRRFPGARATVQRWDAEGKTLAQLADEANGWKRFAAGAAPDLVVVAIPGTAQPASGDYFAQYSAVVNAVLPFGRGGWDTLLIAPNVAHPGAGAGVQAAARLAAEVAAGKDLPWLERRDGDRRPAAELLAEGWTPTHP